MIKYSELAKNKILKETFWSFATKGSTFVLFFLANIFLARSLGVEKFGIWSFFISIFSVLALLSYFGINASAKKYIAQYNGTDEVVAVALSSLKLRIYFSLFFSLVIFLFGDFIFKIFNKPEIENITIFIAPLIFLSGLIEYFKDIFNGFHRIKYNFIINLVQYGLILILAILFLNSLNNLKFLVFIYLFSYAVTVSCGFIIFNKAFFVKKNKNQEKGYFKDIFLYSVPLFFVSIGFLISTEIDTLMLGYFSDNYQVGVFSVAKQIVNKLPQIGIAIGVGVMPIFAKMSFENVGKNKKIFYKLIKLNTLIFGGLSIFILFFSDNLISIVYGERYQESALILKILLPYMIFFSYSTFLSSFLNYRGLAKKRALNLIFSVILNVVLNIILIPKFGAIGAAVGTSISYSPYLLLNFYEVRKEFEKIESSNQI